MLDGMVANNLSGASPDEVWLTCDDPGPVAVAYCAPERMTRATWNALLVAVRPDRQRRGLGTALMRHAEHASRSRGGRLLLVETSGLADFEPVRAFYRGLGYAEEARIRDFYDAGEDKVVFRKAL